VRKPEAELASTLNRVVEAGLLFRQGVPPHAIYLFKHALVQDAAYGTLLRESRRALHARIAQTLEDKFADIAENQPELLARHCTEAGLIEKAASLWGKAGQRSLARSALVEAVTQLTRALDQIASLPATPALRRKQIKHQVALANALMHTRGYGAAETRAALDQARFLIEQGDALGEAPEDPMMLFSVLNGFWVTNFVAFNGDVVCDLAAQFLALAEKKSAIVPLMIGRRLMGAALTFTGNVAQGKAHFDQAIALYDPAEHRPLATRFGQDAGVAILSHRSWALWILGYPNAALADSGQALKRAREIGQAPSLMYALNFAAWRHILCGHYAVANTEIQELVALADEKSTSQWKASGMVLRGWLFALTGNASEAVPMINSGISLYRSGGATMLVPWCLSCVARAYAELDQFGDAWRCIGEAVTAVEITKEKWCEAGVQRLAGEIALMLPQPDTTKAEAFFSRALTTAHAQQAKSWQLRAAMSIARLWRDQRKRQQAHDLLAPV
jgi:tetratricopeptide (TPR) repeat protein